MSNRKTETYSFQAIDDNGKYHPLNIDIHYLRHDEDSPWEESTRDAYIPGVGKVNTKDGEIFQTLEGAQLRRVR